MVSETAKELIRNRVDIVDLIGQHARLTRSGRGFKAPCPFHSEKHASFYVSPERGTWHCFGACGEGGDIFTFVQKREGISFSEALRMLAQRAGVELPRYEKRSEAEDEQAARLSAALAAANQYFRAALEGKTGARAREYLAKRGVNEVSVERFGLGFAPRGGLLEYLQRSGYGGDVALESGLAGASDDGRTYEMFRDRLMFPIRDRGGQVIGFGGRTLGDGQPKYLNGPRTALFDKSRSLYAIDLAWPAIRQRRVAVVVEGYLDALTAHQFGHSNVVATLGTALTERHFEGLRRVADTIVLALDADLAGQNATRRGVEVAAKASLDLADLVPVTDARGRTSLQAALQTRLKVLSLPSGKDPDELVRRDPTEWPRLVAAAKPVVDFVLDRLGHQHDLGTADGKRRAVQEGMAVVSKLVDPIERAHYEQRLAAMVGVDESAVRLAGVARGYRPSDRPSPRAGTTDRISAPSDGEARALALRYLAGQPVEALAAADFEGAEQRAIFERVSELPGVERPAEHVDQLREMLDPELLEAFEAVAAWVARLASLETGQVLEEAELAGLTLQRERLRKAYQEIQALLAETEGAAADDSLRGLLLDVSHRLAELNRSPKLRRVGALALRPRMAREVLGAS
ncbi:MAG: DNA primase [Chloroflexi bacterium]|nr:DNA primase [Chloroflexota bacterium]